jgi:molybdate transport system substrate-binding protein
MLTPNRLQAWFRRRKAPAAAPASAPGLVAHRPRLAPRPRPSLRPATALLRAAALLLAIALLPALAGCSSGAPAPGKEAPAEVVISAAASLKDALTEAQTAYATAHPGITLRFNFGSSGALQQQIEQGAPADLFIPAAAENMQALVSKSLVDQASVRTLVTNKVVLVQPAGGPLAGWDDLKAARVKRIGIGNPAHVPAGIYGKTVLEKLGLWAAVAPKLVLGEDVRQVLHYVETGAVEAGIVYSTDAAASGGAHVAVVAEAPADSYPPVAYPMAVLKGARNARPAQAFADFLASPDGQAIFTKYGFGGAK